MALGDATVTTLSNVLKTKYDQKKLYKMMYPQCAFFARMRKDEKFGGNNARITLRYGRPQGGSMTFTTTQANKTSSADGAFLLTRAKDYYTSGISAEALLAADGDENTVLNGLKGEMEGTTIAFARSIANQLYGNGGAARGRISAGSNVATNTVTLAEPNNIVFFEPQMYVQASAADGTSGALRNGGAHELIAAVDRDLGTIRSTSGAWNTTIAAIAALDYLFREGDFGLAAKGLLAWLPLVAPTGGDNFFGQDRSFDATRMAGVRFAATAGAAKEDTLIDASARLGRENGMPDAVYLHNIDRADIVKNLFGKAEFEMIKGTDGEIGFKAIILEGDKGPLRLMSDPNCPKGNFFLLQEDTWVIKSIKGLPHLINEDGLNMLRESAADGYEWRYRALWQLGCEAPGLNAVGTF